MKMSVRSFFAAVALTFLPMENQAESHNVPHPLDLPSAITFALENNFAIRSARERLRAQEGVITTVTASAWPSITAGGNYQRSDMTSVVTNAQGGPPLFLPAGPFWRMTVTGAQTLFAGGGIRASIRQSQLTRDASVFELQAVINDTLLDIRTRFYDVLLAREQVTVEEQNVSLLEAQLRDTTFRVEAGRASDFERLRAEVALANAKAPLIKAKNGVRLALEELRRVLGARDSQAVGLGDPSAVYGTLEPDPIDIDQTRALFAAANRPELKRIGMLEAAGDAGLAAARARFYPSLGVSAGAEARKGPTNRLGDSRSGLRLGVQSQWQLTPWSTNGQIKETKSLIEQTRLTESETRLKIEIEVRRALSGLEQATELLRATEKSVGQAEEAVRLATARLDVGMATQLDLLQAQVELTRARTSQLGAKHGYNVAAAQLRHATGAAGVMYTDTSAAISAKAR